MEKVGSGLEKVGRSVKVGLSVEKVGSSWGEGRVDLGGV